MKQVIKSRTRVRLIGSKWKGVTMRMKSDPAAAIEEAKRIAKKQLEASKACVEAIYGAFTVETVIPEAGRARVVKTLQKGDKKEAKERPYIVTLGYPEYLSVGTETFCQTFWAASPEDAIAQARIAVCDSNGYEREDGDDYFVISVFQGLSNGGDLNPDR